MRATPAASAGRRGDDRGRKRRRDEHTRGRDGAANPAAVRNRRVSRLPALHDRLLLLSLRADPGADRLFLQRKPFGDALDRRSEEHTSELQSLMRISSAVFSMKKQK